uniref:Antitermination NusB domain-containing protein n=1 Tax=Juniperus flaccida TaxID=487036 RepID=A0A3Q8C0Z7_9CONI|nr:antitermination NusB domain-containing protein [Juniperus flaccida]
MALPAYLCSGISLTSYPHELFRSSSNSLHTRTSQRLLCTTSLIDTEQGNSSKPAKYRLRPKKSKPKSVDKPKELKAKVVDKSKKLFSNVSPHRAASAVRLLRIEEQGAYADLLNGNSNEIKYIHSTLGFRIKPLDARDSRLVTDIVAGVLRWKRYLDYLIFSLYRGTKGANDIEPLLQQILRIGAYEIVKLGMPPYAVVNENVTLAKAALRIGAGNMVNGILRKIASCKENDTLPLPAVEGDSRSKARALGVIYSHPVWMVRRWMSYLGQEATINFMEWNNNPPCFGLRANNNKGISRDNLVVLLNKLEVPYKLSPYLEEFVHVTTGLQNVIQAGLIKEGTCAVQDESAGLVVSVVDPQPGETIIDCCAAPGGKTLFMASHLQGQGKVIAIDINRGRLRMVEEGAIIQALDSVVTTCHNDLCDFVVGSSIQADKVLLDAPCSGLGVLRKKPDLRWKRSLEDLEQLMSLQDKLLDAASLLVKPGGILVYSTCSIDPGENKERVDSFLTRHPEFIIQSVEKFVPDEFVSEEGFYFSHTRNHFLDGAFAARLYRMTN